MNSSESENVSDLADRGSHGLMRLRVFGAEKQSLPEIQAGIRACELLEEGWKAFLSKQDIKDKNLPESVYLVTTGVRTGRFLLGPDELESIAAEARIMREKMEPLAENRESLSKSEMGKCESFFAKIARLFLEIQT